MIQLLTGYLLVDIGLPCLLVLNFILFILIEFFRPTSPLWYKWYFRMNRILVYVSLTMAKSFQVMIRDIPFTTSISLKGATVDSIWNDFFMGYNVQIPILTNLLALVCSCFLFGIMTKDVTSYKFILMLTISLHFLLVFILAIVIQGEYNKFVSFVIYSTFNLLFGIFEGLTQVCKYKMTFMWYEVRNEYAVLSALLGMESVIEMCFGFQISLILYESFGKIETMLYAGGILLTSILLGIALLRPVPELQDDTRYYMYLVGKYIQQVRKSSTHDETHKPFNQEQENSIELPILLDSENGDDSHNDNDNNNDIQPVESIHQPSMSETLVSENSNENYPTSLHLNPSNNCDESQREAHLRRLKIDTQWSEKHTDALFQLKSLTTHTPIDEFEDILESDILHATESLETIPDMYGNQQSHLRSANLVDVLTNSHFWILGIANFFLGVLSNQSKSSIATYFVVTSDVGKMWSSVSLYVLSMSGFLAILLSLLMLGCCVSRKKIGVVLNASFIAAIGLIFSLLGFTLFYINIPISVIRVIGYFMSYFGRIVAGCMVNFEIFEIASGYKYIGLTAGLFSASYYGGSMMSCFIHESVSSQLMYTLHILLVMLSNISCIVLFSIASLTSCHRGVKLKKSGSAVLLNGNVNKGISLGYQEKLQYTEEVEDWNSER